MRRFIRSLGFAVHGIKTAYSREANFRIHSFCTILVILAGIVFNISCIEWIILTICTCAVLFAELMNTAIEELCNIVHRERHRGIKLVKDVSAAAVLVTAIGAAICAAIIFIPKIILFINQ